MLLNYKLASQIAIFVLIVIALSVAITIAHRADAWLLILAYWITLTIKNIIDAKGSK